MILIMIMVTIMFRFRLRYDYGFDFGYVMVPKNYSNYTSKDTKRNTVKVSFLARDRERDREREFFSV